MSRGLSLLDRLLVGLVGLLSLGAGAWAILWALGHPVGQELAGRVSLDAIDGFMAGAWYPAALLLAAVLLLALGTWLLAANLRRRSCNLLTAGESSDIGQLTLSVTQLAKATGAQIARHPDVTGVETATRIDRGRHVATITVHADPEVRMRSLLGSLEEAEADFHAAIPGLDVETRYLLRLDPVTPG